MPARHGTLPRTNVRGEMGVLRVARSLVVASFLNPRAGGAAVLLASVAVAINAAAAGATTTVDLVGPAGSVQFGQSVLVLPNGNFVVTDPLFDGDGLPNSGRSTLYDGRTNAADQHTHRLTANDQVGGGGLGGRHQQLRRGQQLQLAQRCGRSVRRDHVGRWTRRV